MRLILSESEKKHLKWRNNLRYLCNSVRSAWGYGRLKVWSDVYSKMGMSLPSSVNGNQPIVWEEVKLFLQKQEQELENKIKYETIQPPTRDISSDSIRNTETTRTSGCSEVSSSGSENRSQTVSTSTEITQEQSQVSATKESVKASTLIASALNKLTEENDYGFEVSPNEHEKLAHFWFQKKAITELLTKIKEGKRGLLLLAGTGTGKTFICAGVLRRLLDMNYHEGKTLSHMPYLYVTRTTVVEQTCRVMRNLYNIPPSQDVEVINIEQLRSKAGQFWIKENVIVRGGDEEVEWTWKKYIQPCVFILDESQGAKNSDSTQSKIVYAYNNIPDNSLLISVSATPFTKVSEAQAFAVSTGRSLEHLGFPAGTTISNETWPAYAKAIAAPASPDEHNEAAIDRLMKDLDEYVVRVKGVRPQFDAKNGIERIDFQSPEAKRFYDDAWNRFLEEKKKKEESVDGDKFIFVILLKFSMAAEKIRADILAERAFNKVKNGKAAVIACKFKGTIIEVVKILHEKYGVTRNEISLVWGGGQTQLTAKQKAKAKIRALKSKLEAAGISEDEMMETMDLDEVEDRELQDLPAHLRLESQSMDERQEEIDKFQSGKSLYCLYTFRAGGVGLSLHHSDEMTQFKCRRKKSGYAFEEDIPNVPVRPRDVDIAPTYSAIELVQGLGRAPRLTSLSETKQTLLFYKGTVEDEIADIVSQKLRCLTKVVRQKESWSDVIVGGDKSKYMENGELALGDGDSNTLIGEDEE